MKSLYEEIDQFLLMHKVSSSTKRIYQKYLHHFSQYIETLSGKSAFEIYLDQFYILKDRGGLIVKKLPIDGKFMDQYFYKNLNRSYSWLSCSRSSLGSFFKHLYKLYALPNPIQLMEFDLKSLQPIPKKRKTFSRHELLKLMHSVVSHSEDLFRDIMLFTLLISTGCRPGEILSLKVNQIVHEHDLLYLSHTKTKTQRYVALRKGMGTLLIQYCTQQNISGAQYLFTDLNGECLSNQDLNKLLNKFLVSANLAPRTAHSFRHSFATHMYESGADISIIQ